MAVKIDEAVPASTRQAVVGRRRSAGNLLSKQRYCGAETTGTFGSERCGRGPKGEGVRCDEIRVPAYHGSVWMRHGLA